MRLKAKYGYKSAIIVDEELLRDLDSLLKKYLNEPKYKASLMNEDTITFDSVEELINYDNHSRGAIKTLDICCGYDNYMYFRPYFADINSYKTSVDITYYSDNRDKSEEFKRKLDELLKKHKQTIAYTFVSKISLFYLSILGMAVCVTSSIMSLLKDKHKSDVVSFSEGFPVVCISLAIIVLICCLIWQVKKRYYPPIVFLIGERKKEYEKITAGKIRFFWGLIVATIIAICVALFLK